MLRLFIELVVQEWCTGMRSSRVLTSLLHTSVALPAGDSYKLGTKGLIAWAGLVSALPCSRVSGRRRMGLLACGLPLSSPHPADQVLSIA